MKSTKSLRSNSTKSGRSSKFSPSKKSKKKLPKTPEEPSPFNWDPSGNTNPKQSFNWDKKSMSTNAKATDAPTVTDTPLGEFKKFFVEMERDMATKMTEIHESMVDEMKTEIGCRAANAIDRRAKEAVTKHLDFSHHFDITSNDSDNEEESKRWIQEA